MSKEKYNNIILFFHTILFTIINIINIIVNILLYCMDTQKLESQIILSVFFPKTAVAVFQKVPVPSHRNI